MGTDDQGRLSRWSQRKLKARHAGDPQGASDDDVTAGQDDADGVDPSINETEPAELPDLPPIESLDKESDYRPFLAEGVPADLARAALRRLWTSDPVFANLDGLNDYDEDYTIIDRVVRAAKAGSDVNETRRRAKEATAETNPPQQQNDAARHDPAEADNTPTRGADDKDDDPSGRQATLRRVDRTTDLPEG